MSYDLSFYKRKTDFTSKDDIEEYLNKLPNVTSENGTQWFYENPDTGVYCSFEYYELDNDDEEIEVIDFEDFVDTNFAFRINFIRPQFFGKECFPLVDKFVETLNLFVLNPQGENKPIQYQKGALEQEWAATNLRISKSHFKEFGLSYLELEKSNYSWKFCLNKNYLQNKLGDNYFVPEIFYFKKNDTEIVYTLSVWPEHIPYVLPKVDYIFVQKRIEKLFEIQNEEGLVKYEDLVAILGQFFEKKGEYMILHPSETVKISKMFNELKIIGRFVEIGEGISVERFVNTKDD